MHGGCLGCAPLGENGIEYFIEFPCLEIQPHKDATLGIADFNQSELPKCDGEVAEESSRPRYLIVDDTAICRSIILRRLRALDFDCDEAENGLMAVNMIQTSMLERRPYDAVVIDNSMPVMTGPEATKAIRELGYSGRMYGVTGNVMDEDLEDFLRQGLDKVFPKPLSTENFNIISQQDGAIV